MFFLEEITVKNPIYLNYFAIILATVAYLLLGILWYSPIAFGKRSIKYDDAERYDKQPTSLFGAYLGELVLSFIIAHGLAFFIALVGGGIYNGLILALFIWICFVATINFSAVLWSRKSAKNFCVHSGFSLVGFLLMGIILGWLS